MAISGFSRHGLCGLAGLIAAGSLSALGPAQAQPEIAGLVVDDDTGPIEGALVTIAGTDARACSDAQGEFRFPSTPGYGYTIRVVRNGYRAEHFNIVANTRDTSAAVVLRRENGSHFNDCRVRVISPRQPYWAEDPEYPPERITRMISGIIVDEVTAEPLRNVLVSTEPASATVRTSTNGTYAIWSNLEAGLYTVTASLEGYEDTEAVVRIPPGDNPGNTTADIPIRRAEEKKKRWFFPPLIRRKDD